METNQFCEKKEMNSKKKKEKKKEKINKMKRTQINKINEKSECAIKTFMQATLHFNEGKL